MGRPWDSGPNVMTTSLIRVKPGVAGRGIGISWSRPPVLAKWQKIWVGIKPVAVGELPTGFRVMTAWSIGTDER